MQSMKITDLLPGSDDIPEPCRCFGMSVAGPLEYFPSYTSTHGIRHLKRIRSPVGRLLWFFLTIASTCACIYHICLIFGRYFHHDYIVKVDILHGRDVRFPKVTFCNLNPFRFDGSTNLPVGYRAGRVAGRSMFYYDRLDMLLRIASDKLMNDIDK
ncbi:hypothetical protein LSH36_32g01008 [Paralvinella palmiformis]|uniref:Uncharacterized protein n=1 Tax=Paralvinella palmiformis TaxID=53620 RepID=A0AAD9K8H0_9ANNE|nr:hypothetical protein LSH36_32g01008 [Paralvinella palmiformis]